MEELVKYLHEKQICQCCGKEFYYTNKQIRTRLKHLENGENIIVACSRVCAMSLLNKSQDHKNKVKKSCLSKYGVDNYAKTKECQEKMRKTCLKKYGVKTYNNTNKAKQTCLERYGVEHYSKTNEFKDQLNEKSDIIKEKRRETFLKHFGKEYYFQTDLFKNNRKDFYLKNYGVDEYFKTQEFKDKEYVTKRINNSFNKSSKEDQVYNLLLTILDKNNIIRQYKSKKYPFTCDFYIPEKDLYIEYNGHWTHGKESFDKNNIEHQKILEEWKRKSEKSKFYKNAIYTWTDLDVRKLKAFKENNLNYKIFWNLEEVKNFIGGL